MNSATRQSGEPRRLSQRQALVAVERRGERAAHAGLGEQGLVIQMRQERFRLVPVQDHDRMLARLAQDFRRIVLQLTNVDGLHRSLIMWERIAPTLLAASYPGFPSQ